MKCNKTNVNGSCFVDRPGHKMTLSRLVVWVAHVAGWVGDELVE